jgi:hypothetical protein
MCRASFAGMSETHLVDVVRCDRDNPRSDARRCVFDCECGVVLTTAPCRLVGERARAACAVCGQRYHVELISPGTWRVCKQMADSACV